jgi:copper chaperone NosL
MIRTITAAAVAWGLLASACGGAGPPEPAALDTRNDACATCRMSVSAARFAAQIVAPGDEPLFFDDLGCLARYLREHETLAPGAAVFVADHRTSAWVAAGEAVYTRVPTLDTPMASHLVAHASPASRDADPAVRGGLPLEPSAVFNRPLPGGAR